MQDLDEIRKALESLYDRFGPDAVNNLLKDQQPRPKPFKSERGAPSFDLIGRNALVYILVQAVRLATNQNIKWCCSWLEGKVTIRAREMRGGRMWRRSWDKGGSFRRHYYAACACFRSGDPLGKEAFSDALRGLLFWRFHNVNPRWGYMATTRTGMSLDFLPADHGSATEIKTLFRGFDAIAALVLEVDCQLKDISVEPGVEPLERLFSYISVEPGVEPFVERLLPFLGSPIDLLQEIKRQLEQHPFKRCAENTVR